MRGSRGIRLDLDQDGIRQRSGQREASESSRTVERVTTLALVALAAVMIACGGLGITEEDPVSRLDAVRERGELACATQTDIPGFGYFDSSGRAVGFDIDLCRAVAAAALGDSEAITVRYVKYGEIGDLLVAGEVDMVSRTLTWTTTREAEQGEFIAVMFYDGQGFMVRKDSGISSAMELDGATVCVLVGTSAEWNVQEYFRRNGMSVKTVGDDVGPSVYASYESGDCDATSVDKSQLAAVRSGFAEPEAHFILPETISKEPLSPVVPHGDREWEDLVKMVMYVLINAEELEVTQSNVDAMMSSDDIIIRRMLGLEGDFGQSAVGLENDFAADVIRAVGNYGEIYDRYLGPEGDAFTLTRGPNELWTNGGLIYAPPLR